MSSQKTKKIVSLGIIFISLLLGTIAAPALLSIDKSTGLFIGGILGIVSLRFIYPEIFNETEEQAKIERIAMKQKNFLDLYFFHPTKTPLTFSMVIFVLMIILALVLDTLNLQQIASEVLQIGIMGTLFLWGTSGFLIISRKKFIENSGQNIIIYKGFGAIFTGILFITIGWGGIMLIALSSIMNS